MLATINLKGTGDAEREKHTCQCSGPAVIILLLWKKATRLSDTFRQRLPKKSDRQRADAFTASLFIIVSLIFLLSFLLTAPTQQLLVPHVSEVATSCSLFPLSEGREEERRTSPRPTTRYCYDSYVLRTRASVPSFRSTESTGHPLDLSRDVVKLTYFPPPPISRESYGTTYILRLC